MTPTSDMAPAPDQPTDHPDPFMIDPRTAKQVQVGDKYADGFDRFAVALGSMWAADRAERQAVVEALRDRLNAVLMQTHREVQRGVYRQE